MPPLTVAEYAELARDRLPASVWDFVEGGAGLERTVVANLAGFAQARIRPRVLAGAATADSRVTLFGAAAAAPIAVAPLAYHALAHPDGELATVRGAGAAGLPCTVATMASRTLEEVAAAASGPLWFQLYPMRDRAVTVDLVRRAADAGYGAIVVTVDAPHLGDRRRDARNGFCLPSDVRPANLLRYAVGDDPRDPAVHARACFESAGWDLLARIRAVTTLPVVVKGIMRGDDAARAVAEGADGIIVSNHGGRQLDNVVSTLDALPDVVAAVAGRRPVLVDGGVRRGVDVLVARALGADAVLVGRPVLHALAAGGADGVRALFDCLADEYRDAMVLAGCTGEQGPDPSLVGSGQPGAVLRAGDLHASVTDPVLETMTFLNEVTARYPRAISFAPGRPWDAGYDIADAFDLAREYLDHRGDPTGRHLLQYGPTAGTITDLLATLLRAEEGIDVDPAAIVVTVGAQEALLLVLRALFAVPRDTLLVASPCYSGITGAARLLDIRVVEVPEGPDGLRVADVARAAAHERAQGHRVRACYVVPEAANPSGATLPEAQRRDLIAAARAHSLLLLEDSPYRVFAGADRPPSLKALDPDHTVVQIGSFAKTVYPGLRVGYVVADQPVVHDDGRTGPLAAELTKIKSMVTVNTPGLSQAVVGGFLLRHKMRLAVANAAAAAGYAAVLNRVLATLRECFPDPDRAGVSWNRPAGGFFVTVRVPFHADAEALRRCALDHGVIWTPMAYFRRDGGGHDHIRLSCSYLTPDDAEEGVRRLARFIAGTGPYADTAAPRRTS